jgi:hypothetical protein
VACAVLTEELRHGLASTDALERGVGDGVEEFELLGVAADDPGRTTRPGGGERRVALLGVRQPELAIVAVEDGLVGHAAANVVAVAALAEEDVETGGRAPACSIARWSRLIGLSPSPISAWPSWCATTSERMERMVSAKRDCGPLKE